MVIVAINPSPYNPRIGYGNWLQQNPLVNHDFPTSMAQRGGKSAFSTDIFRHILGETWRKTQVPYSRLFSVLTFLDSISNIHTHSLYFPCFLLFKHGQLTPPSAPAPKHLLCARLLPLGCLVHLVGEGFPWDFLFFFLVLISGWWFQPLWKIWKSVGMIIPNIWKNKTCSKPPTSYMFWLFWFWTSCWMIFEKWIEMGIVFDLLFESLRVPGAFCCLFGYYPTTWASACVQELGSSSFQLGCVLETSQQQKLKHQLRGLMVHTGYQARSSSDLFSVRTWGEPLHLTSLGCVHGVIVPIISNYQQHLGNPHPLTSLLLPWTTLN